jgi:hypothetical protein
LAYQQLPQNPNHETKKEEMPNPANTKTTNPGAKEKNFPIPKRKLYKTYGSFQILISPEAR